MLARGVEKGRNGRLSIQIYRNDPERSASGFFGDKNVVEKTERTSTFNVKSYVVSVLF
jgi:hypothetical protein